MARKINFEYVKEHVESRNWKILDTEYYNQEQILSLICPDGHLVQKTWRMIKRNGLQCKECNKEWNNRKVQLYLDENYKGFKFLGDYKTNIDSYKIECQNGHIFNTTWTNFLGNKNKCQECVKEERLLTFKSKVLEEGYNLLSINTEIDKAVIQCNCKHEPIEVSISKFLSGKNRCGQCGIEKRASQRRLSFEFVKNYIEVESQSSYKLLSNDYRNNETELIVECDKGHIYSTNFVKFYNMGCRCPDCSDVKKYTYEDVKLYIESIDYTLLSNEYVNYNQPLSIICDRGHETSTMTFGNIKSGHRCRICRDENNCGENNSSWKGGLTPLNKYLREQLYEWKDKSLESTNYTCDITGVKGRLQIHHKYPFHQIVTDIMSILNIEIKNNIGNYAQNELDIISKKFKEYHKDNLGVPLLTTVHNFFHRIFGYENNEKQYIYFKQNYHELLLEYSNIAKELKLVD